MIHLKKKRLCTTIDTIYNGCLAIIASGMLPMQSDAQLTHDFAWLVRPDIQTASMAKTGFLSNPHPLNVCTAMGMNRMLSVKYYMPDYSSPHSKHLLHFVQLICIYY